MSQSPPPTDTLESPSPRLSAEAVEAVLADFRSWLLADPPPLPPASTEPPVDLTTLVGQFTALRQEVNLQTRAARTQAEQTAESLRQTAELLDRLDRTDEPAAATEPGPLVKALVEVADALALADREASKAADALAPALAALEAEAPTRGGWWFGRTARKQAAEQQQTRTEAALRARQVLDAVRAGYAMSRQRVERALSSAGLEVVECVGREFDPELMEAIEATPDTGRPAGEVLDEVRRGYRLGERVYRCALVRVAR